jgi:hypothetical protein
MGDPDGLLCAGSLTRSGVAVVSALSVGVSARSCGAAVRLYRLTSASRVTWWTVFPSDDSQSSQISAVSRAMS